MDLLTVCVILPAKDEEIAIEDAIRCADRLDHPRNVFEIIVIEDGSSGETTTIGRRKAVLLRAKCVAGGVSREKPSALNPAIAGSTGDVIAVFDSVTRHEPDLLPRVA